MGSSVWWVSSESCRCRWSSKLLSEGSADASSDFDSVTVNGKFRLFCNRLRSGLTRGEGNVAVVHRSGWGCMSALSKVKAEGS